jgi:hypothetical protein
LWETMTEMIYVYLYLIFLLKFWIYNLLFETMTSLKIWVKNDNDLLRLYIWN